MTDWLDSLNAKQREAVEMQYGPMLVLAGHGTGKTHVLFSRARYLIEECDVLPSQILIVTFTNKAANEIRKRLTTQLGIEQVMEMNISTIHRLAVRIMTAAFDLETESEDDDGRKKKQRRPEIIDAPVAKEYVNQAMDQAGINTTYYPYRKGWEIISSWLSTGKEADALDPRWQQVFEIYMGLLAADKKWDLAQLIKYALTSLDNNPVIEEAMNFDYLLLDEMQDTTIQEYEMLARISGDNALFVGSPAQSIYRWRGADSEQLIERLQRDYLHTKTVTLDENYRSSQPIIDIAEAMFPDSPETKLVSSFEGNTKTVLAQFGSELQESEHLAREIGKLHWAYGLPWNEIGVLIRVWNQTASIEEALNRQNIPYVLFGNQVPFYDQEEVQQMLGYLRLILDLAGKEISTEGAIDRIINTPPRGVDPRTVKVLRRKKANLEWVDFFKGMTDLDLRDQIRDALKELFEFLESMSKQVDSLMPDELIAKIIEHTGWDTWLEEDLYGFRKLNVLRELMSKGTRYTSTERFVHDVLKEMHSNIEGDGIVISSIHAAKGLEWNAVFIPGLVEGILPHWRAARAADDPVEERSIMHVAVSRAKHICWMSSYVERIETDGRRKNLQTSRFIQRIPAHLVSKYDPVTPLGDGVYDAINHEENEADAGFEFVF